MPKPRWKVTVKLFFKEIGWDNVAWIKWLRIVPSGELCEYEVRSKIFWTDAAMYTAVVLAQSTGGWQDYHV